MASVSLGLPPSFAPIHTQVCPTKTEYVAPLMTKMMGVDVTRLSKGHTRPRERHSSASGGGAAAEAAGAAEAAAGADAVMTANGMTVPDCPRAFSRQEGGGAR